MMSATESAKVRGLPVARATAPAKLVNTLDHMPEAPRPPAHERRQAKQVITWTRVPGGGVGSELCGAGDGARTRDLRRDRPPNFPEFLSDVPNSPRRFAAEDGSEVGTLVEVRSRCRNAEREAGPPFLQCARNF